MSCSTKGGGCINKVDGAKQLHIIRQLAEVKGIKMKIYKVAVFSVFAIYLSCSNTRKLELICLNKDVNFIKYKPKVFYRIDSALKVYDGISDKVYKYAACEKVNEFSDKQGIFINVITKRGFDRIFEIDRSCKIKKVLTFW